MATLSIHRVKKIKARPIRQLGYSGTYARDVHIEYSEAREDRVFIVTLFSDAREALKLRARK